MRPLSAIFLSTLAAGVLSAGPITYTFTGPGSTGTLNGVGFSNQTVTFSLTTDTGSISGSANCDAGCATPSAPFLFSVSGFPSGTIIDSVNFTDCGPLCVFPGPQSVGFSDPTRFFVFVTSSSLIGYNLRSPIGPITSDQAVLEQFGSISTSAGTLAVTNPVTWTFTATTVPEPTLLGLMLLGTLAIAAKKTRISRLRSSALSTKDREF